MLLTKFDKNRKYISYDHWCGGWNNIRQTIEGIAIAAKATDRVIILPPDGFILFISNHDLKEERGDMWWHLDKDAFTKEFDCIEYKDVPYYQKFSDELQWFNGILEDDGVYCPELGYPLKNWGAEQFDVEFCAYGRITDEKDFEDFSAGRLKVDLNRDEQFIHFGRNMYAQPLYNFYLPKEERQEGKEAIMRGVRLKQEFYDAVEAVIPDDFDAIHIRRGDFRFTNTTHVNDQYNNLVEYCEKRGVRKDVPLYVLTDEVDRTLFEELEEEYNCIFLSDLFPDIGVIDYYQDPPLWRCKSCLGRHILAMAYDMIIPTYAKVFYGSRVSTFTNYINILRGYKGMKDCALLGHNFDYTKREEFDKFPWETNKYFWEVLIPELWYGNETF